MSLTTIDWLMYRAKASPDKSLEALRGGLGSYGSNLQAKARKSGWKGYTHSADLTMMGMHIGLMAFGGEHQKDFITVNLSAQGCKFVEDWSETRFNLAKLPAYEERRVDIALDTFKREVTHQKVVEAHRSGLFNSNGKPPSMTRIEPEDPYEGATVYVGKRTSDKFFRGYQKGYELVRKLPVRVDFINGVPIDDMYRMELELKAKNAPLPSDLIDNRDHYFAGAYPYLEGVIKAEPMPLNHRRESLPQRDLKIALANIRKQYGSTLFTALAAYGGDVGAVMEQIIGTKHNEALVARGVLSVDPYEEWNS